MTTPEIKITSNKILSDNWYILKRVAFEYQKSDGSWETQRREVYDRGNGAAILLYDKLEKTVVLIRQFRMPTYMNGNPTGMMIEACAGLLEEENPEECIRRETEEETGYQVRDVRKIFQAYMSPGSVTEIIHFFVAEYSRDMKIGEGGGLETEHENIDVLEMPFTDALSMIQSGEIRDAKTIMLLQYAQINNLLELE
jgi:GDP-mannose pyrophosphatase NudK